MTLKRVLIVDDDAPVASLLRISLETFGQGYEVEIAPNGHEALEKLCHQTFDAVITDYGMPEMDGPETAKMIRKYIEEEGLI